MKKGIITGNFHRSVLEYLSNDSLVDSGLETKQTVLLFWPITMRDALITVLDFKAM